MARPLHLCFTGAGRVPRSSRGRIRTAVRRETAAVNCSITTPLFTRQPPHVAQQSGPSRAHGIAGSRALEEHVWCSRCVRPTRARSEIVTWVAGSRTSSLPHRASPRAGGWCYPRPPVSPPFWDTVRRSRAPSRSPNRSRVGWEPCSSRHGGSSWCGVSSGQRRLDRVKGQVGEFGRDRRETYRREQVLELRARPSSADGLFRLPNPNDVERVVRCSAVVT
jgi:hypothetical protein